MKGSLLQRQEKLIEEMLNSGVSNVEVFTAIHFICAGWIKNGVITDEYKELAQNGLHQDIKEVSEIKPKWASKPARSQQWIKK